MSFEENTSQKQIIIGNLHMNKKKKVSFAHDKRDANVKRVMSNFNNNNCAIIIIMKAIIFIKYNLRNKLYFGLIIFRKSNVRKNCLLMANKLVIKNKNIISTNI